MPRHYALMLLTIILTLGGLSGCDDVPDISLPNEPPVANDDTVEILQDQQVDISATSNDSDIDGDPLTISITTAPTNGTAEVTDTGFVQYIPPSGFIGTDSLTYQITDTAGFSDDAVISITIKKRQLRAIFSTETTPVVRAGGDPLRRLYMIDTLHPGEAIELSQTLATDESVRNWALDLVQQQAVMLTDADRIVAAPFTDPAAAESFDIELAADETVDSGFDVAPSGIAAYTVNNRYVRAISTLDGSVASADTGWTDSTMELQFFTGTGINVILSGTLGSGVDEGGAIYLQTLAEVVPIQILDNADLATPPQTRFLPVNNAMLWLLEEPGDTPPGGYSCQQLPDQRLGNVLYTLLTLPQVSNDLNVSSGLLDNAQGLISYTLASVTNSTYIAACPDGSDLAQIIEVPFSVPSSARVVGSLTDTSDLLYGVDLASGGSALLFVVDGDTGLRAQQVDLTVTDTDAPITDITASLPDFALYDAGTGLQAPDSAYSEEASHWVYVAPVGGEPTRLVWVELETLDADSVDLPFSATSPRSDGYYGFATSAAGGVDTSVAMIDFANPTAQTIVVPGTIAPVSGALAAPAIRLIPVPVADIP